jgi:hypothetical protein
LRRRVSAPVNGLALRGDAGASPQADHVVAGPHPLDDGQDVAGHGASQTAHPGSSATLDFRLARLIHALTTIRMYLGASPASRSM